MSAVCRMSAIWRCFRSGRSFANWASGRHPLTSTATCSPGLYGFSKSTTRACAVPATPSQIETAVPTVHLQPFVMLPLSASRAVRSHPKYRWCRSLLGSCRRRHRLGSNRRRQRPSPGTAGVPPALDRATGTGVAVIGIAGGTRRSQGGYTASFRKPGTASCSAR